jgi:5,10-methylenetetrahydromethanopterin reductase
VPDVDRRGREVEVSPAEGGEIVMPTLGMKLDAIPTEEVPPLAREIERHGFDEVWVCEDLGRNGGITQAALALGATERCRVGIGILPAAVRNVAYLAMENASLCRAHPGRFLPGLGHGMPNWLKQVDAHPVSLLACLEEVTLVTRRLVVGETVTFHGRHVEIEDVTLQFPLPEAPPLCWGVRGPKGIELASRVADGLILAEGLRPRPRGGRLRADGPRRGERRLRLVLDRPRPDLGGRALAGHGRRRPRQELHALAAARELGADEATDAVVGQLTVSGDADGCAEAIARLYEAGADSVVLQPIPGTERRQLEEVAPMLPALGRPAMTD